MKLKMFKTCQARRRCTYLLGTPSLDIEFQMWMSWLIYRETPSPSPKERKWRISMITLSIYMSFTHYLCVWLFVRLVALLFSPVLSSALPCFHARDPHPTVPNHKFNTIDWDSHTQHIPKPQIRSHITISRILSNQIVKDKDSMHQGTCCSRKASNRDPHVCMLIKLRRCDSDLRRRYRVYKWISEAHLLQPTCSRVFGVTAI